MEDEQQKTVLVWLFISLAIVLSAVFLSAAYKGAAAEKTKQLELIIQLEQIQAEGAGNAS